MNLFEAVRTAILDLALHKFRSALATLGIVFGVASVLAMVSISEGAKRQTLDQIAVLGVDNLLVRTINPSSSSANASAPAEANQQRIPEYGLKRRDLEHVRTTFPYVKYAVGLRNMRMNLYTRSGRPLVDLSVIATEPDYLKITRSHVSRGRFITQLDGDDYKQVCVVGHEAARRLFGYQDPINDWVRIGDDWFKVVGILQNDARLKDAGGDDINNHIFISLGLAQKRFGDLSLRRQAGTYEASRIQLDGIALQMESDELIAATTDRLMAYLKRTHKQVDYDIVVPQELMRQKEATQRIFSIVMASIAGISLLIGGIGIMNIMLANVADRRKEIGTRRALGARKIDIVIQFVLECATLSSLGGVAGVGVGYGLAMAVSQYANWPVIVTPMSIALGLIVSCAAGILFGLWPAWQAAKVNPIEALRSV